MYCLHQFGPRPSSVKFPRSGDDCRTFCRAAPPRSLDVHTFPSSYISQLAPEGCIRSGKERGPILGTQVSLQRVPDLSSPPRSRSIHHTFGYTDRQGSQHNAVDIAAPRDTACVFFDLSKMEVKEDRMDSRLRGEAPLALDKRARGNDGAVGSCTSGATMRVEVMPCNWNW